MKKPRPSPAGLVICGGFACLAHSSSHQPGPGGANLHMGRYAAHGVRLASRKRGWNP